MTSQGISIIIPCFNAGSLIIDAIQSILLQPTKLPFEIIVINDGSTDSKTLEALEEMSSFYEVKVIHLENNSGAQYARNVGLKAACFDYIFMMDADDCLNTDATVLSQGCYFDNAVSILESDPDVAFVHCRVSYFGFSEGDYHRLSTLTVEQVVSKYHVPTFIIYRKQDAYRAGLYLEIIDKWQDWTFAIALLNSRLNAGMESTLKYLDQPYYLYRQHNQTERISQRSVSEKSMCLLTIKQYPKIFQQYYPKATSKEVVDQLLRER